MSKITSIENFIAEKLKDCNAAAISAAKAINSFLIKAKQQGFSLVSASDGEEIHKVEDRFHALDVIFSVDESFVYLKNGRFITTLQIVLGSDGIEAIADYGVNLKSDLERLSTDEKNKEEQMERIGSIMSQVESIYA